MITKKNKDPFIRFEITNTHHINKNTHYIEYIKPGDLQCKRGKCLCIGMVTMKQSVTENPVFRLNVIFTLHDLIPCKM